MVKFEMGNLDNYVFEVRKDEVIVDVLTAEEAKEKFHISDEQLNKDCLLIRRKPYEIVKISNREMTEDELERKKKTFSKWMKEWDYVTSIIKGEEKCS